MEAERVSQVPVIEPNGRLPAWVELRRWRDEADNQGICDAINRSLAADGSQDRTSLEEVVAAHASATPQRDARRDAILAVVGGEIVGYGRPSWYEELEDKRLYNTIAFLVPEQRGFGIWRAMLRRCEARAAEIAEGHPTGTRKILQAWSAQPEVDWPCLLASEGYREVRHFWDMLRPTKPGLEAPALPPGLELRPVKDSGFRAVWEAQRDVAPDHWQYRVADWTEDAFEAWREENRADTAFWQVAWEGDRVAGMVLASIDQEANARRGIHQGKTEHIFVRREWRGKGLATSLIAMALEALGREGMDEAFLGVDEENPSGAMRLYEKLGYRAVRKDTWHRKWLAGPSSSDDAQLY
jgi:GNAT superfamily N-acetyltransferase